MFLQLPASPAATTQGPELVYHVDKLSQAFWSAIGRFAAFSTLDSHCSALIERVLWEVGVLADDGLVALLRLTPVLSPIQIFYY